MLQPITERNRQPCHPCRVDKANVDEVANVHGDGNVRSICITRQKTAQFIWLFGIDEQCRSRILFDSGNIKLLSLELSVAFAKPKYTKGQINRAGDILITDCASECDRDFADEVLANWRAAHGYPINTFQATLRAKLKEIDGNAIVAQRLKRTPSIVLKLKRFEGMKLARMQDIGGLRAVVSNIARVRKLEKSYRSSRFNHKLTSSKDYLNCPKSDGYRGIHLIYRYFNSNAPVYDGLSLELQIRTKMQHAWATAVETMGTFLGQALELLSNPVDGWVESGGGLGEAEAILERDALQDVG